MYYNLFISHAWKYGDAYDRLVGLLNQAFASSWLNWSAPEDKPVVPEWMVVPSEQILRAIGDKIRMADCVLVIAGMYANHSVWMQAEMDLARRLGKPLIGIRPWGSEMMPREVYERTRVDVGWNSVSIMDAIQGLCSPR